MNGRTVPQKSIDALHRAGGCATNGCSQLVRSIADPVLVAHLRRLACEMELPADAARLRAEADALDGGAS